MTKKLIWRLSSLPTPSELTELVKNELITKEEAREILITEKEVTERDADSFKEEIKFLREMVDKLSKGNQSNTITYIHEYPTKPTWTWYAPYNNLWAGGAVNSLYKSGVNGIAGPVSSGSGSIQDCSFSSIQNF